MSSGVYQRGEENEGIYGFLVDDIKQEVSRSHRLLLLQGSQSHPVCASVVLCQDAAWELEENAYEELLQVYQHCDANKCLSHSGRTCSSRTGWFQILRCMLCGSRGTHRKCASLNAFETDWACEDCAAVVDGTASLPRHTDSPQPPGQRRSMSSKRSLILTPCQSPIVCKRPLLSGGSAKEILQELASQISQHHPPMPVVVSGNMVLEAAMELVKRSDFKPSHALAVRFTSSKHIPSLGTCPGNTRRFLSLLVQQLQNTIFEGPDGAKNLTLDAQALREDVYFDVGCLLSLSLIHGGPPLGFFSRALYMRLFNFPWDTPLTVEDMGNTGFTDKVKKAIQTVYTPITIGRCATSLEDVLIYATSADVVPAVGFSPNPTLSFLNPLDPAGAFPKSQPSSNHLLLPVVPSYQVFKKNMEYAVCQLTVMQAI
ncbi:unnamed protein product [Coregonus sp. 'balchen']|nr:unnamed protein product [Coregonus sp. 'balchen']